jgi:hypothetical protein
LAPLLITLAPWSDFGIFEHVPGKSLGADRRGHPLNHGGRAGNALAGRGCRSTTALDIVHGAIDPNCVVFRSRIERAAQLSQPCREAPVSVPSARPTIRAPADELWAWPERYSVADLATRRGASGGKLRAAGIDDEVLRGIIAQAMTADPNRRSERRFSAPSSGRLAARRAQRPASIAPHSATRRQGCGLRALDFRGDR